MAKLDILSKNRSVTAAELEGGLLFFVIDCLIFVSSWIFIMLDRWGICFWWIFIGFEIV